jgi:hypothetical protein
MKLKIAIDKLKTSVKSKLVVVISENPAKAVNEI